LRRPEKCSCGELLELEGKHGAVKVKMFSDICEERKIIDICDFLK
jgi:hypothetical protein